MKKGFTLIELLIVIGVLGILATTTVLVLDPSEILKRSRDVQRITDLRNLRNAIDLYLVRTPDPTLNGTVCKQGSTSVTHPWRASTPDSFGVPMTIANFALQTFVNPDTAIDSALVSSAAVRNIDGSGWVSVPINQITGINPPIAKLPVDPINIAENDFWASVTPFPGVIGPDPALFYVYQCYGLTYEMNANMESEKYSFGGDKDVESTDGGTRACYAATGGPASVRCDVPGTPTKADQIYEIGNDPGLDL